MESFQQRSCRRNGGLFRLLSVNDSRFTDLIAYFQQRIHASAALGNIGNLTAADLLHPFFRSRQQIFPIQQNFPIDPGIAGEQADQRYQQYTFTASGLPDDRSPAAVLQTKRYIIHCFHIRSGK